MNLSIYPLDESRMQDYFAFFDDHAFADHQEWSWCYCTYYHCDPEVERQIQADGRGKESIRAYAECLLREGQLRGYLAYIDGKVCGFVNVNDRAAYRRLRMHPEFFADAETKVKAVVCFIIAEGYRRQGIAAALLQRACEDAAVDGFSSIEAYPVDAPSEEVFTHYHGHRSLYEKAGFVACEERGGAHLPAYTLMRKKLG